jgi:mRNA interferase MazF
MENQYKKSFDEWNKVKKQLDTKEHILNLKVGQVWWCKLGLNIGSEQNGSYLNFERPVLIIARFSVNTVLILPLSSNKKFGKYYFKINENSTVILRQPRLIDIKRLNREAKEIKVSRKEVKNIIYKFKKLF